MGLYIDGSETPSAGDQLKAVAGSPPTLLEIESPSQITASSPAWATNTEIFTLSKSIHPLLSVT